MQCPTCNVENPADATVCGNCSSEFGTKKSPLSDDAFMRTITDDLEPLAPTPPRPAVTSDPLRTITDDSDSFVPTWSSPVSLGSAPSGIFSGKLTPGTLFGGRYEILRLLGEGGMGSVFMARDREVDRTVALKVIRPELASDKEVLGRFKQELILARQITHKNVIRIFDLSQTDGVKFITMEFVEGRDLHSLIKEGNSFTLLEKVKIIHQVCRALDAAHSEGVVHRDLKPHNIMIENTGRAVVMDFGVAHSMAQAGFTRTGALLGTPAYMSPEQAKGEKVDTRSDLFSLGVIFYELLTGKLPYESESMMGMLMKRIHERPRPPIELNPEIPQSISDCVLKCLSADLDHRYQSAQEVMNDLEGWEGAPTTFRTVITQPAPSIPLPPSSGQAVVASARPRKTMAWIVAGVALAMFAVSGFYFRDRFAPQPTGPQEPVTLMIADISNHTGDPLFDGTLEPVIKIALEGAGFISAYDRTRVRELGLPAQKGKVDEKAARQIALNQGLGAVVSGSLDRDGDGYKLTIQAIQAVTGDAIGNATQTAPNKDEVIFAATKAASLIRTALGDSTSEADQRFAMESLSASSLEAVHEYSLAMEALSNGDSKEARLRFTKATELDEKFGLAYGGVATASKNLGEQQEAEKYIKLAFTHIDSMTERERFRTRGSYYALIGDYSQCVQEYEGLIEKYPSDVAAHNNLGYCQSHLRNFSEAIEETEKAARILTKRPLYRFNIALFRIYGSDFQTAETEVTQLLRENPTHENGHLSLAYAKLGLNQIAGATETYGKLAQISPSGASIATSGLADLAVYEGRFQAASEILQRGADADLAAKRSGAAAAKFAALGRVLWLRGQKGAALAALDRALATAKDVDLRLIAGSILAEAGEFAKASALVNELSQGLQLEPRAYAKLIAGGIALKSGKAADAVQLFQEANSILDTWLGHYYLGRAYLAAGAYQQADSEFERCIARRGEATELFMNREPTYNYFPPVYYYLGQAREGQKSAGFAESYRTFLSIRGKSTEDPLVADARRRAQ